jgi:PST family polysaccharide transporter
MRPVLLAPLCFGAAYGVELATQELPAIVQLTLGIAAGVVPLLLCLLVPAYRRDLSQIVGFVKQVRRPAPATGRPANTTDVDEAAQDDAVVIQEGKGER